jgi:hypothetical protein
MKEGVYLLRKLMILVAYTFMILMNVLANVIPFNGLNTGQVSDRYENLFTPAAYTFSIWGLIYILLFFYVIDDLLDKNYKEKGSISLYFIISSIANGLWIVTWHYDFIGLSLIFMLVILFSLIKIRSDINQNPQDRHKKLQRKIPFSIYFGWITVATIANVTVLLVSIGFENVLFSQVTWLNIVLILGLLISGLTLWKYKDIFYGFVILWAYIGILSKHLSLDGFSANYTSVIVTLIICLLLLIGETGVCIYLNQKKQASTFKT